MLDHLFAVTVTVAAVGLRWLLEPWLGDQLALVTLPGAVLASVWFGGWRSAVLSAVTGYVACDLLFIGSPYGSADVVGLVAYAASASIIIGLATMMRTARARAVTDRESLRITLASIGDAVITTDTHGRVEFLNMVATELTGWTSTEAAGRSLEDVFHIIAEDTRQAVENPAIRALRDGVVVGLANHTLLVARDGTERVIDDSAAPIRDEEGRAVGCVLVFRDVTERRQAEQRLRLQERELSDFFDNANVALRLVDPHGVILRANRAELGLLGYDREEYVGRSIAEFHVEAAVAEDILGRLRDGEVVRDEPVRLRCKDGSIKDVLVTSSGLFDDREFVHSRCFTIDVTDSIPAERARALLAAIVDGSGDAIISKSLEGTILSWNAGAERLYGYPAAEAIGRPITLIIPSELEAEERSILAALQRGERIDGFDTVRLTRDGRRVDVSLTVSPVKDESGRIIAAAKTARDITERKRSEQQLAIRARQQAVIAELGELVLREPGLEDLRSRLVTAVATHLEIECCSILEPDPDREGLLLTAGVGWREGLIGRSVAAEPGSLVGYALAARRPLYVEDIREDDRFRAGPLLVEHGIVSGVCCLIPGAKEESCGLLGAYTTRRRAFTRDDLSFLQSTANLLGAAIERDRVRSSLEESQQRFQVMADAAPVMIWMSGSDRLLEWVNLRWLEFTGRTMEQELGNGWSEGVHPDDVERRLQTYASAFEARCPFKMEFRLRRHDGEHRWLFEHGIPRFSSNNEFTGYIGSCIDITERRRAEQALLEADRRKDEFLATLAHELRNPLAPIRNSLEILKRAQPAGELLVQVREMIERQIAQIVRLVDDLLDVGRITRDRLSLTKEQVELTSIVHRAVETSRPLAEENLQLLEVHLPDQPVYFEGDAVRLTQVLSNLLDNACKYSPEGGRIRVAAERRGDEIMLSVQDNGIGIAPDKIEGVFEMFAQVRDTIDRSRGGLGIGLTLAKRLVELHGGSITAYSEGSGLGSTFEVRLPALGATSAAPEPPPRTQSPCEAPRHILVVDDNVDSAESLTALLRSIGHETRAVYDGHQALETAELHRPDVAFLDIGLPKMSGLDVCRRLREQPWGRSMLIVALTGWGQAEDRRRSEDAGFDAHLVKPVDFDKLLALLGRAKR